MNYRALRCVLFPVFAALTLVLAGRAEDIPSDGFEKRPSDAIPWLPGAINAAQPLWLSSSPLITVISTDAGGGGQSIRIPKHVTGEARRKLSLKGHVPLTNGEVLFADLKIRPASWNTGAYWNMPQWQPSDGFQIFVDGHALAFLQTSAGSQLYLAKFVPSQTWYGSWSPCPYNFALPGAPLDAAGGYYAKDWARLTLRIDPAGTADVWLNGKLVFKGCQRNPAAGTAYSGPSFYVDGTTMGDTGVDDVSFTVTNPLFTDVDRDGMPDAWELEQGLDIAVNDRNLDTDGDGISNFEEYEIGTKAGSADSDGDGVPDKWEREHYMNPLLAYDSSQDWDGDGATNFEEYQGNTDLWSWSSTPKEVIYVMVREPYYYQYGYYYGYEDGTYYSPYGTLQTALDVAPTGGTIVILPSYNSLSGPVNTGITISRSVTIKGNGALLDGAYDPYGYGYPTPQFRGITITGGHVVIEDMGFTKCTSWSGSAIYADSELNPYNPPGSMSVTLRRCGFMECTTEVHGGAVRLNRVPAATLECCTFWSCASFGPGGAISALGTPALIDRCEFESNWTTDKGGAIQLDECNATLRNSLLRWNNAGGNGGALSIANCAAMKVEYCTVLASRTGGYGAAFWNAGPQAASITGSILWKNSIDMIGTIATDTQVESLAAGGWNVRYSTTHSQTFSGAANGLGNNATDFLLDIDSPLLKPNSGAIDTGDPDLVPAIDFDGNSRKWLTPGAGSSPADRGCYEFCDTDGDGMSDYWESIYGLAVNDAGDRDKDADQDGFTNYEEWIAKTAPTSYGSIPAGARVIYVDPDTGNDAANGAFYTPIKSIGQALTMSSPGLPMPRICLRDGVYKGANNRNLTTLYGSGSRRFYLKGINGKSRVTIDCEGQGRFLIIQSSAFDGLCGIEGVTIRNGALMGGSGTQGAALLITGTQSTSQPFLARCTFAGCRAAVEGGAIYVQAGSVSIEDCEFFGNEVVSGNGGSISISANSSSHAVYIQGSTFSYNIASETGGAIYAKGLLRAYGCSFFRNTARQGGAVAIVNSATPSGGTSIPATDTTVPAGNTSTFNTGYNHGLVLAVVPPYNPGGTFFTHGLPPSVLNECKLTENYAWASNSAVTMGGALYTLYSGAQFEKLTVERNRSANSPGTAGCTGGGIGFLGETTFRSCRIMGNECAGPGGGAAGSGVQPGFYNTAFCDNVSGANGGALLVSSAIPEGVVRLLHCTVTYNKSLQYAIADAEPGVAHVESSVVWFNTGTPDETSPLDEAQGVAPCSLPFTRSCNLETPYAVPGGVPPEDLNISKEPPLAWDHYHLLSTGFDNTGASAARVADLGVPGQRVDIDAEPRPNTTANHPERGCDEFTDTPPAPGIPGDGIPDWYVAIIAALSPSDNITPASPNFGELKPWGSEAPTVAQVFQYGLNPANSPSNTDTDGDGLSDGDEILAYNTSPKSGGSNNGNITDAQIAGKGKTTDTDKDGIYDDYEALPLDPKFQWPKAPERQVYRAVSLGMDTFALGVTHGGKILYQDFADPQDLYECHLYVTSQDDPEAVIGGPLPTSDTSWVKHYSKNLPSGHMGDLPRIVDDGSGARVLDRFWIHGDHEFDDLLRVGEWSTTTGIRTWLNVEIDAPDTAPAMPFDRDQGSEWFTPPRKFAPGGNMWLDEEGAIYGLIYYDNGFIYSPDLHFGWPYVDTEGGADARAYILSAWESASQPPLELEGLRNPPGLGHDLSTHSIIPDNWSRAIQEGDWRVENWPGKNSWIQFHRSAKMVGYNAISPQGAILYSESTDGDGWETDNAQFVFMRVDSAGRKYKLPKSQLPSPNTSWCYAVFDTPAPEVLPPLDPTHGEFRSAIVAGVVHKRDKEGEIKRFACLWERPRAEAGSDPPPEPKLIPKYNTGGPLLTGSLEYINTTWIRDISPEGEILYFQPSVDPNHPTPYDPYPPYDQLWRNRETIDLSHFFPPPPDTTAVGTYKPVGFGKDGAIVANFTNAEGRQAVILYPVKAGVAVDANRDAEIKFDGTDWTHPRKPYTFWVNDDRDIGHMVDISVTDWTGEYEEDDVFPTEKAVADCDEPGIKYQRDLEDLTRIWLDLDELNKIYPLSDSSITLHAEIRQVPGFSDFNIPPAINLFRAREYDGGRRYLTDESQAQLQITGNWADELCTVDDWETPVEVPREAWTGSMSLPSNDKTLYLLFEGKKKGKGKLVFSLYKDDKRMAELPPVYFDLQTASDMYETYTVGDVLTQNIDEVFVGDTGGASYSEWPNSAAEQTTGKKLPAPRSDEERAYMMYVHGWNMEVHEGNISFDDKTHFANTAFKRLWHQGYKGRFGAYRWPTYYQVGNQPWNTEWHNFNASEQRAWNSAKPLIPLLSRLAKTYQRNGQSRICIFGHSMGNIVCSEMLRQFGASAPIKTYISCQAALAAHCWDAVNPDVQVLGVLGILDSYTPNIYKAYWQPAGDTQDKHQWETDGRPSYMAPEYMPGNVTYVNYCNPDDYALGAWKFNQAYKPSLFYGWDHSSGPNGPANEFWRTQGLGFRTLKFPEDRYEIFSWAAEARSSATGAALGTSGKFTETVNLKLAPYSFGDKHPGHSAEFRSTVQKRWAFWESFLTSSRVSP
ncbi:MAG TPA: alpha/beta hydrolase [Verrucomicrobiales bacterium]|nr:alpha/beta hydrolase [Verrucomicrobiales bacterium]